MDTDPDYFIEIPNRVLLLSCIAESLNMSENEVSFVKGYGESILGRVNLDKYLAEGQSKGLFKWYLTGSDLQGKFGSKN
jgi:hypothetical protein